VDRIAAAPMTITDSIDVVRRRRSVVVTVALVALALSFLLTSSAPRIYSATATIYVRNPSELFVDAAEVASRRRGSTSWSPTSPSGAPPTPTSSPSR
jgi:uncharacterized protein involved in exopolysaccharide biosynthesis